MLKSTNKGQNWSKLKFESEYDYSDLSFINVDEGWIAGMLETDSSGIGVILHTSDGGSTFEKQIEIESNNSFTTKYFRAIKFQDSLIGWALAGDYFDNFSSTSLYKTINGGSTWQIINEIINIPTLNIKFIDNDTLWFGGGLNARLVTSFDGGNSLNYYGKDTIYAHEIAPIS